MRRAYFSPAGLLLLLAACSSHEGQDAASPAAKAGTHAIDKAETGEAADVKGEALAKIDPAADKKDDRPRIGALGPHTWIYKRAERKGLAIGKMRIGTSAV